MLVNFLRGFIEKKALKIMMRLKPFHCSACIDHVFGATAITP
jgi:hypothetical protein